MYTNQMRITGLSGLDTESMITQLMRAESINLQRLRQKKQLLTWKQEAYVSATNTMKAFQSSVLSLTSATSLRLSSNMKGFNASVMNSLGEKTSSIGVKADTKATGGIHTLNVTSLATKASYTGTAVAAEMKSTNSLDGASFQEGDSIRVNVDGVTKEIKIDSSYFRTPGSGETANSVFTGAMQSAINSSFGAGKLKVSTDSADLLVFKAESGHTASVSSGTRVSATQKYGEFITGSDPGSAAGNEYKFKLTVGSTSKDLTITLYENADNAAIASAINTAIANSELSGVQASTDTDGNLVFKNGNAAAAASISDADDGIQLSSLYNPAGGSVGASMTSADSLENIGINSGRSTAFNMGDTLAKIMGISDGDTRSFTINGKSFNFEGTDTMQTVLTTINNSGAGVKLSFESFTSTFKLESLEAGVANNIDISGDTDIFTSVMNFAIGTTYDADNDPNGLKAATDAAFTLDGVTTTRSSNTFTINGMTITLNANTKLGAYEINLEKDTTAVSDLIKGFVTEYNKMIDYLNKEIKTTRPKSDKYTYYEPLSDDEKKDLSERDIELWDEKAKTGMLYRDDILQSITSQMRTVMYDSVTLSDGRKISLYQIGITVSSKLSDQGKLVIDEDKLTKMLESDGDAVAELFTKSSGISSTDSKQRNARLKEEGIAERLNDIITWATNTSSPLNTRAGIGGVASESSSDMYKKIRAQEEKISDMLVYLSRREQYYYTMFSKLEASMSQSDSQMAYLQSMMGM